MANDIRIKLDFLKHYKIGLLKKLAGENSPLNLLHLYLYTGANKPDGKLNMSLFEIEMAAEWSGEEGVFANALLKCRLLDEVEGGYEVHDWFDHNTYAATGDKRSDESRLNRLKGVNEDLYNYWTGLGHTSITKEQYKELTSSTPQGTVKHPSSPLKAPLSHYTTLPSHSTTTSQPKPIIKDPPNPPERGGEKIPLDGYDYICITIKEKQKLIEDYGVSEATTIIKEVDEARGVNKTKFDRKYKNHYLVCRQWLNRRRKEMEERKQLIEHKAQVNATIKRPQPKFAGDRW